MLKSIESGRFQSLHPSFKSPSIISDSERVSKICLITTPIAGEIQRNRKKSRIASKARANVFKLEILKFQTLIRLVKAAEEGARGIRKDED